MVPLKHTKVEFQVKKEWALYKCPPPKKQPTIVKAKSAGQPGVASAKSKPKEKAEPDQLPSPAGQ
eukprot:12420852-Karenia_brevis.AAC.1